MKGQVCLGLIGAGGFGAHHLSAITALEASGEIRLAAIADPDVTQLWRLREQPRYQRVSLHEDYREMLATNPDLNAVTIAAPIPFHYEITQACLERGLFVYLEKPPAPMLWQLDRLVELDTQGRVSVGFQLVGSIWMQHLKHLIAEGKLGEILEIRACGCWPRPDSYYRRARWAGLMTYDGRPTFDGPTTNAFAHLVHNIMFLGVRELAGFGQPVEVQGEIYRARPIEGYDVSCLRGMLASGTRFIACFTHAAEKLMPYEMEVIGTKGHARVSNDGNSFESDTCGRMDCTETVLELLTKSNSVFIDFVLGRRETRLSDTRAYVLATNAMLLSSCGIHTVDKQWVHRSGRSTDGFYEVRDLCSNIERAFRQGCMLSELGVPWAVNTLPVATACLENGSSTKVDLFFNGKDPVEYEKFSSGAAV